MHYERKESGDRERTRRRGKPGPLPTSGPVGGSAFFGASLSHALQLEIRRRSRACLLYQFSYAFSKTLSNSTGDNQTNFEPLLDNNNPRLEKARSPYDITHAFKANFVYELPYGPGKRWSGGKLMNELLGGWSLSGIWNYNAGSPFSVVSGLGTLNRVVSSTSTNTASKRHHPGSAAERHQWRLHDRHRPYFVSPSVINTDGRGAEFGTTFPNEVFFNPTAGTVGNLQRRLFTGPWQWSWDMSGLKSFRFRERHTLDFHYEGCVIWI